MLFDLEPRETLHTEPETPAAVHEDKQDALTRLAAENSAWRMRVHVEVPTTHLRDGPAGGALGLGAGHLVDEQFLEEAGGRISVEPQLGFIHRIPSLLWGQISRS